MYRCMHLSHRYVCIAMYASLRMHVSVYASRCMHLSHLLVYPSTMHCYLFIDIYRLLSINCCLHLSIAVYIYLLIQWAGGSIGWQLHARVHRLAIACRVPSDMDITPRSKKQLHARCPSTCLCTCRHVSVHVDNCMQGAKRCTFWMRGYRLQASHQASHG